MRLSCRERGKTALRGQIKPLPKEEAMTDETPDPFLKGGICQWSCHKIQLNLQRNRYTLIYNRHGRERDDD